VKEKMSLPTNPSLVFISCTQTWNAPQAELVGVNDTLLTGMSCATALNHYADRNYEVVAHSLVHERAGWLEAPYFVATWTMSKRHATEVSGKIYTRSL
jgi:hypothetical protein